MNDINQYIRHNWREIAIGAGTGVIGFLALRGHNILPVLLIGGLLAIVFYAKTGGAAAGGWKQLDDSEHSCKQVDFSEIGGQSRAIEEVTEALDLMVDEERADSLGIRPLRGLLLAGPPGTGKTMIARAASRYIGSCFMSASGSEFVEMYAGVGAQRIRELFSRAKEKARKRKEEAALVFIDELEIIGGKRGRNSSHLEYDQTLNQLLIEMDGISRDSGPRVLVMGATNRQDLLDEALTRPGRFDRIVQVDLPDFEGRKEILKIYLDSKPVGESVAVDSLARATFGFSGAQLESLTNEAAILAFRQNCAVIRQQHLRESIEKVMMGEKIDRRPPDRQLRRVAIHELGHALVGELLEPDSVASVTISPRGGSLGYVRRSLPEDRFLYTASQLTAEIDFALAGCAAERLYLGQGSTGVSGDFDKATTLAKRLVLSGMTRVGIVSEDMLSSGQLNDLIGEILNAEMGKVSSMLMNTAAFFEESVSVLMQKETVSGDLLREIISRHGVSLNQPPDSQASWRRSASMTDTAGMRG